MRRKILDSLKKHPEWKGIDADLSHRFGSWFNRGFLTLERIDWHTPAIILEKLIEYEAVHEIAGWGDLRRRLADDRRCFAFFHPALPHEPLIFIEVALTRGISSAIQPLIATDAPELASDPTRAPVVAELARLDDASWYTNAAQTERLRKLLLPLAADYFLNAKQ